MLQNARVTDHFYIIKGKPTVGRGVVRVVKLLDAKG